MEKSGKKSRPESKAIKINLFRKWIKIGTLSFAVLFFIWFLFTIPRLIKLKNNFQTLQNQNLINILVIPDSILKKTSMPEFPPINWSQLSQRVDSEGVVFTDYDKMGTRGVSGKQRSFSSIARFSLNHFSKFFETGQREDFLLAFKQIDFLTKSFKTTKIDGEEVGFWEMNFDLGYQYNVKAPWHSGFHQAYCIIAMLEAYLITGDLKYLDIIEKGIRAFKYDLSKGGLSYKTKNGGLFFEEVAAIPPHHILNGHMRALLILNECYHYTGSLETKNIFELGCIGLKDLLPEFDQYGYSLYSLSPNPSLKNHFNIANPNYHNLHIAELKALTVITSEKIYEIYSSKWDSETSGVWEYGWTALYIMFKDSMRFIKLIENKIGFNLTAR